MSDLRQWLTSLGLDCYAEVFAKNNIDSKTLADLTEQDLAALGVSLGHRKRLLGAVPGDRLSSPKMPRHEGARSRQNLRAERRLSELKLATSSGFLDSITMSAAAPASAPSKLTYNAMSGRLRILVPAPVSRTPFSPNSDRAFFRFAERSFSLRLISDAVSLLTRASCSCLAWNGPPRFDPVAQNSAYSCKF
jgi:hypothetical protein